MCHSFTCRSQHPELAYELKAFNGRSDYGPFIDVSIPGEYVWGIQRTSLVVDTMISAVEHSEMIKIHSQK